MIPLERLEGCWTVARWFFWFAVLGIALIAYVPVSCGPVNQPMKAWAKNDLVQTLIAIKGFQTEYGTYPLQSPPNTDLLIDLGNQRDLYNVLRAIEQGKGSPQAKIQNHRGIVFFEGKKAQATQPKSGFGEDGTLYDPWGGIYEFVLDTNNDGGVVVPSEWKHRDSGKTVKSAAIGYSPGKTDTAKDDVATW